MTSSNIWDQVLARIETKVNRHSFYTWFKPTCFVSEDPGGVTVRVPSLILKDWLVKHYSGALANWLKPLPRRSVPKAATSCSTKSSVHRL